MVKMAYKKFETLSTKAADFYKGSESIASASEESASAVAQIKEPRNKPFGSLSFWTFPKLG